MLQNIYIVQELLKAGANPNIKNNDENYPIHWGKFVILFITLRMKYL